MTIDLKLPENLILKPTITVFGVGGAGGNAINNMIKANLQGATFVAANTDAQALENSLAEHKLQLGLSTTKGLGAGASPDVGRQSAEESEQDIKELLNGSNMVFITAGMGGGTGTGAAPVVAKIAKEFGILTVGVVTKPFHFEGHYRMKLAEYGLSEMQKYVDTLIVIPNQNLFLIANEKTTFADAFKMADDVLHAGVRGVTDLMIMPGLINLDFADIRAVMTNMGKAMMGTGESDDDKDRAIKAAEAAISNPLLDHRSVKGAKGVLINITGGMDMTLYEVDAAANRIREEVGESEANIIFGSTFNKELDGLIRVSVVATGIDLGAAKDANAKQNLSKDQNSTRPSLAETYGISKEPQKPVHANIVGVGVGATSNSNSNSTITNSNSQNSSKMSHSKELKSENISNSATSQNSAQNDPNKQSSDKITEDKSNPQTDYRSYPLMSHDIKPENKTVNHNNSTDFNQNQSQNHSHAQQSFSFNNPNAGQGSVNNQNSNLQRNNNHNSENFQNPSAPNQTFHNPTNQRGNFTNSEPKIISPIINQSKSDVEPQKPKQSLFSRMINSFRSSSNEEKNVNESSSNLSVKSDKVTPMTDQSDVYDVPAFLRRK